MKNVAGWVPVYKWGDSTNGLLDFEKAHVQVQDFTQIVDQFRRIYQNCSQINERKPKDINS